MRGLPGASVALVALPCALAAVLVKVLYEWWIHKPLFAIAMHGAAAAAVGVMFATGWTILRPLRASVPIYRLVLFSGGACALAMTGFSPLAILIGAALIGCVFPGTQSTQ
jgi:chromate transport protein ChrA